MKQESENPRRAVICPNCKSLTSQSDLIQLKKSTICSLCEERYLENLKTKVVESTEDLSECEYAGFWTRAGAYLIDGVILNVIQLPIVPILNLLSPQSDSESLMMMQLFISYIIFLAYFTYFHSSEKQATFGKQLLKIRVINSDGGDLDKREAYKRALSLMLSALTLCIGFLIAVWDPEKRTLHDRICSTRVIKLPKTQL